MNGDQAAQIAQLQEQLKTLQAAQPATSGINGWQQPPKMPDLDVQGVGIPLSIQTPKGKLRVTVFLGSQHVSSPDVLMATVEKMADLGMPLDIWESKSTWQTAKKSWR